MRPGLRRRLRFPGLRRPPSRAEWYSLGAVLVLLSTVTAAWAATGTSYPCTGVDNADGTRTVVCYPNGTPSPSVSPSVSPSASPTPSPSPTSPSPSPSPSVSPSPSPSPSVSPSPSPSPSPSGTMLNCLQQLAACGFPNAANTGVQPGITLTTVNGDVTLGTTGQVFQNKLVTGCISVTSANVTIRNVKITGNCSYSIDTARGPAYDIGPTTIEHVEIACPSGGTAIGERHLIVRWANIHGCENGFDLDSDLILTDSYLHDLLQDGNAHTDGLQIWAGANNVTISHTVIDASGITTSAIITGAGGTNGVVISNSILAGGAYTLYCMNNSTGWSVTNVRFVKTGYGYMDSCQNVPVWSGNIDDATGAVLPKTL